VTLEYYDLSDGSEMMKVVSIDSSSGTPVAAYIEQVDQVTMVKVVDLTEGAYIERELMMVKVRAVGKEREEMKRMADIFRGRVIDVTDKSYTIELTGHGVKLDAFIDALDSAAIMETVRTGASGIARGERTLKA
jgi:acetolactate synthase-1/3 small subunit